jgi:hypothetical protein
MASVMRATASSLTSCTRLMSAPLVIPTATAAAVLDTLAARQVGVSDEGLARRPEQDGNLGCDLAEAVDQLEVLLDRLPKPMPST